jgi:hypothetical protein
LAVRTGAASIAGGNGTSTRTTRRTTIATGASLAATAAALDVRGSWRTGCASCAAEAVVASATYTIPAGKSYTVLTCRAARATAQATVCATATGKFDGADG